MKKVMQEDKYIPNKVSLFFLILFQNTDSIILATCTKHREVLLKGHDHNVAGIFHILF